MHNSGIHPLFELLFFYFSYGWVIKKLKTLFLSFYFFFYLLLWFMIFFLFIHYFLFFPLFFLLFFTFIFLARKWYFKVGIKFKKFRVYIFCWSTFVSSLTTPFFSRPWEPSAALCSLNVPVEKKGYERAQDVWGKDAVVGHISATMFVYYPGSCRITLRCCIITAAGRF